MRKCWHRWTYHHSVEKVVKTYPSGGRRIRSDDWDVCVKCGKVVPSRIMFLRVYGVKNYLSGKRTLDEMMAKWDAKRLEETKKIEELGRKD